MNKWYNKVTLGYIMAPIFSAYLSFRFHYVLTLRKRKQVQTTWNTYELEGGDRMADTVQAANSVDPVKAFEALAKIIGEKEGVEITLKNLKKREIENEGEIG
jgi:hypothetical protein